jgi:hypothetical protein
MKMKPMSKGVQGIPLGVHPKLKVTKNSRFFTFFRWLFTYQIWVVIVVFLMPSLALGVTKTVTAKVTMSFPAITIIQNGMIYSSVAGRLTDSAGVEQDILPTGWRQIQVAPGPVSFTGGAVEFR